MHEHIVLGTEHLTYGTGATVSPQLKQTIARFLSKHLMPSQSLEKSHITVINGCSAAIEHLSWALANPGEGFLLGQPHFGTFIPDLTLRTRVKVLPVPFGSTDPLSIDAVIQYEKALLAVRCEGIKVVGLVLCNPHNPLGRCCSLEFLVDLMRLCEKYGIHLISNEIDALSVWENTMNEKSESVPFCSCLSISLRES